MKDDYDINVFLGRPTIKGTAKDVAKREKALRKEIGLTQKMLAFRSGVSLSSLRRFEQTGEISFVSLIRISDVLGRIDEYVGLFDEAIPTDLSKL